MDAIGKGNVLIRMSSAPCAAISQLAATLFRKARRARDRSPRCRRSAAAMHLDTVFTFADRDCVAARPDFMAKTHHLLLPASNHPSGVESSPRTSPFVDVVAQALGFKKLRVIEAGAATTSAEAHAVGHGANLVCASPGVVYGLRRNTYTQHAARKAGIEVITMSARNSARPPAAATGMTCRSSVIGGF